MANNKKKAPAKSGGYSYDKVVKNRDKNGRPIFFRYEGKKKIRVNQDEYRKVQHTKEYFKKKYKKNWQINYKAAVNQIKEINKKQKSVLLIEQKEKKKKDNEFQLVPKDGKSPFANSMATDIETQILKYGNGEMTRGGKIYLIDKNNLLFVRMFFSEMADIFYEKWKEYKGTDKETNSPQITYYWYWKEFLNKNKIDIFIPLDKIVFSFEQKEFDIILNDLLKKYFGK